MMSWPKTVAGVHFSAGPVHMRSDFARHPVRREFDLLAKPHEVRVLFANFQHDPHATDVGDFKMRLARRDHFAERHFMADHDAIKRREDRQQIGGHRPHIQRRGQLGGQSQKVQLVRQLLVVQALHFAQRDRQSQID